MIVAIIATAACHATIAHGLPAPDNALACTPGAYERFTHREACNGTPPHTLPAAVRRDVLERYSRPNWSGKDGEIDHRVPLFLGGRTTRPNLWPEPDETHVRGYRNAKDRVEFRVYRRVCFSDPRPMRVRTARRIFLADWRHAYRAWKQDGTL